MSDGEPTVLGLINNNLTNLNRKVDGLVTSVGNVDVKQENHDVRLGHIEHDIDCLKDGQKKIKDVVYNHANDKKVHYNQGYKETLPQKLKRKSPELTISGTITTIIILLINHYFGG